MPSLNIVNSSDLTLNATTSHSKITILQKTIVRTSSRLNLANPQEKIRKAPKLKAGG